MAKRAGTMTEEQRKLYSERNKSYWKQRKEAVGETSDLTKAPLEILLDERRLAMRRLERIETAIKAKLEALGLERKASTETEVEAGEGAAQSQVA